MMMRRAWASRPTSRYPWLCENASDFGVPANPDVGAARDEVLANEITTDGKKAGWRVDFPIENGAVDCEILFSPNSGDAIPEKCIKVDVALDQRILRIMANIAVIAFVFVEIKMAFELQTLSDCRDRQLLEYRVRQRRTSFLMMRALSELVSASNRTVQAGPTVFCKQDNRRARREFPSRANRNRR